MSENIWAEFSELVGRRVQVCGCYRVIPGQEALPGSEAASRFLGGMIPEINFFEVEQVWVVGAL